MSFTNAFPFQAEYKGPHPTGRALEGSNKLEVIGLPSIQNADGIVWMSINALVNDTRTEGECSDSIGHPKRIRLRHIK